MIVLPILALASNTERKSSQLAPGTDEHKNTSSLRIQGHARSIMIESPLFILWLRQFKVTNNRDARCHLYIISGVKVLAAA